MSVKFRCLAGLLVLAVLIPAGAGTSHAREEILSYVADIVVQPDGALDVTETIRVRAERRQIRRGIYRDFPTRYVRADGLFQKAGFQVLEVTKDGAPEPYRLEAQGFGVRIYIGRKEVFIPRGDHTYRIRYRTTRQLRFFESHDELYWNVTGNFWSFPILQAEARVQLPDGARIGELNAFTGRIGGRGRDFRIVSQRPSGFVIRSSRPFGAGEGLTIVATFQKGVIGEPGLLQKRLWLLFDNAGLAVLVLGALVLAIFYLVTWQRVGRDPDKGVIIPRFEPPDGVSPAAVSYLNFWGFRKAARRPLAFIAAIVSLAVKGRITLDQKGKTVRLEATDDQTGPVSPGESVILGKVRSRKRGLAFNKASAKTVASVRSAFRDAISDDYDHRYIRNNTGYFIVGLIITIAAVVGFFLLQAPLPEQNGPLLFAAVGGAAGSVFLFLGLGWVFDLLPGGGPKILGTLYSAIGIVTIAGLAVFAVKTLSGAMLLAAFLLLLFGFLNTAFFHLLRAPTVAGRELMDRIEGFKLYLSVAEAERMNMAGAPDVMADVFERFLPFAIALDVEKPWSDAFASQLARVGGDPDNAYRPGWYSGRSFNSTNMAAATGAMVAAMSSSIASATPSSSGSGGGGFSGGGGGGGGGGGW